MLAQTIYRRTKQMRKSCAASGITVSRRTIQRIVLEMKAEEIGSDKIFKETGDIAGLDFTLNRAENAVE